MVKIVNAFLFSILIMYSCSVAQAQNKNNPFTIIDSGSYGYITTAINKIVNNKEEYDEFLLGLYGEEGLKMYPYSSEYSYIFIVFNEQTAGGLNYVVEKISEKGDTIEVVLNIKKEEEQSLKKSMAIAHPYIFFKINKTQAKEIKLIVKE